MNTEILQHASQPIPAPMVIIRCPKGCAFETKLQPEGVAVRAVCEHIIAAHGFQVVRGGVQ